MSIFNRKKKLQKQLEIGSSLVRDNLTLKSEILYNERKVWRAIRQAIPLLDAIISKMSILNGQIYIECNDKGIENEINYFIQNVKIKNTIDESIQNRKGLNQYLIEMSDMALEQGFSLGEIVTDKRKKEIESLKINDSMKFDWRKQYNGDYKLYSINIGSVNEEIKPSFYKQLFGYDIRAQQYLGLFWNIESIARIILRIWNSTELIWWRFGDPSMFIEIKAGKLTKGERLTSLRTAIQDGFDKVFTNRKIGYASDYYQEMPEDTSIEIHVIGESKGKTINLNSEIDIRMLIEQALSKSNLPGWMFGLNWSTTERLSTNQLQSVLNDIWTRQTKIENDLACPIVQIFLDSIGYAKLIRNKDWFPIWEAATISDLLNDANIKKILAEANSIEVNTLRNLLQDGIITREEFRGMIEFMKIIKLKSKINYEHKTLASEYVSQTKIFQN